MVAARKTGKRTEFGDFQTPSGLATEVCRLLSSTGVTPRSILEPTCGRGNFLVAALESFPEAEKVIGIEIDEDYVRVARLNVEAVARDCSVDIRQQNFFAVDWHEVLESLADPVLVIGNPPWVTNAELGVLGSSNLPQKSNFQNHRGIDAITGSGNFDISEWILIRSLEWARGRQAVVAMLCKTAVARKVLLHAWRFGFKLKRSDMYVFDAERHFGATVEACLLVVESSMDHRSFECQVHEDLDDSRIKTVFGFRRNNLVADVKAYDRWKRLEGKEWYKWRSGIKHDCSKIMELRQKDGKFSNGIGEHVDLEDRYLYPLLKSADISNGPIGSLSRWMLVTQRTVGEDTDQIREKAPKTWEYLLRHADFLDRRASSIYRKRPRFSVFGVGDYTFAPWKVAISGFYKKLDFNIIPPYQGKPVVLDDTCYFLACRTQSEAQFLVSLLNSSIAKEFFSAIIFWDAKRPITVAVLRRLDLVAVATELGVEADLERHLKASAKECRESAQYAFSYSN
jgi:hypothetical protein